MSIYGCLGVQYFRIAEHFADWCRGLERFGLKQERRALRVTLQELEWSWEDSVLEVGFSLPGGSYATSVLRELAATNHDPR